MSILKKGVMTVIEGIVFVFLMQGARRVKSVSTEQHKRNPHKLSDQDLWHISAHMNAINWRALGQLDGVLSVTQCRRLNKNW